MVNNHHIISQYAEQRARDIHHDVATASRKAAAEPRRSRRLRFRRTSRTQLVAVKDTVR